MPGARASQKGLAGGPPVSAFPDGLLCVFFGQFFPGSFLGWRGIVPLPPFDPRGQNGQDRALAPGTHGRPRPPRPGPPKPARLGGPSPQGDRGALGRGRFFFFGSCGAPQGRGERGGGGPPAGAGRFCPPISAGRVKTAGPGGGGRSLRVRGDRGGPGPGSGGSFRGPPGPAGSFRREHPRCPTSLRSENNCRF